MSDQELAELSTLRDFVRWGASRFYEAELSFGHGTANAFDEALVLVCHALHLPVGFPHEYLDARLARGEKEAVLDLLRQRIETRVPAPYLTHEAWFAGLSFHVDGRVLVPRSPIAELIEQNFEPWLRADAELEVLDLCTGSGCIAIACAYAFELAHVDAADISPDALDVARINVARHGLDDRVRLVQSDLFGGLGGRHYDLIVSNPPYVSRSDLEAMPREFRHEPLLGLAGGPDGLDVVIRILAQAAGFLRDDGVLVVEVGDSQEALQARFPDVPFLWLEFARGGHGVFLLEADQLRQYRSRFESALVGEV